MLIMLLLFGLRAIFIELYEPLEPLLDEALDFFDRLRFFVCVMGLCSRVK